MAKDSEYQKLCKIALLVSISCVLQISESLIPHPIPGLRLGLANVMTLIALVTLGFKSALEVSILRTILSSFIMGTFMSPPFILSFAGALVSTLIMGFLYWLSSFHQRYRLSLVGISVLSALSHNLVQLYLAYLILIRHKGIFVFLPWMGIGAVLTGWLTGMVAGSVCRRLKETQRPEGIKERIYSGSPALELRHYSPGNSFFHSLGPDIKLISLFALSLLVLVFNNFWLYLWLSLFLIMVALISRASFNFLFLRMKKCSSLVFASFLFPVFLNSGKPVLSGLNTGSVFAFRILFLVFASSLLVRTTPPDDLTQGLTRVLSPLRFLGISQERTAAILSLSWAAMPLFWELSKNAIRQADFKRIRNVRNLIPVLAEIIAGLYLETEKGGYIINYEMQRKEG